jgi:VCBS repeat protein
MKWFVAALLSLCVSTLSADPIVLTFEEFSIDAGHQFIDISNYYNGGFAMDASGNRGPGPRYGLTPYPGSQFVAFGGGGDNGLRIPTFNGPSGFVFSRGITGSFSFVSEGDTGHNALLVSAVDGSGHVLAEDFVSGDVQTFTLRFNGVAKRILLGAPDASHPGPLDFAGYWHFDAVTFTPAKTVPAIWRPSDGMWWTLSDTNGATPSARQWGVTGDVPVAADYDGDGQTDIAVWRPSEGNWYVIPSGGAGAPVTQQGGMDGDVPLTGDFDGDGRTDFAVYRPSNGTWYIMPSTNPGAPVTQQWGLNGDVPVTGDFDGDGKTDFAVYRPSNGTWYIIPSSNPGTPITEQWGVPGDIPLAGDFDGDGKTDIAIWRPSSGTWYVMPSSNPSAWIMQQWGLPEDMPLTGDFDGDGKTDIAVWRPSSGTWYVMPSTDPTAWTAQQWGLPGDIPSSHAPGN